MKRAYLWVGIGFWVGFIFVRWRLSFLGPEIPDPRLLPIYILINVFLQIAVPLGAAFLVAAFGQLLCGLDFDATRLSRRVAALAGDSRLILGLLVAALGIAIFWLHLAEKPMVKLIGVEVLAIATELLFASGLVLFGVKIFLTILNPRVATDRFRANLIGFDELKPLLISGMVLLSLSAIVMMPPIYTFLSVGFLNGAAVYLLGPMQTLFGCLGGALIAGYLLGKSLDEPQKSSDETLDVFGYRTAVGGGVTLVAFGFLLSVIGDWVWGPNISFLGLDNLTLAQPLGLGTMAIGSLIMVSGLVSWLTTSSVKSRLGAGG